MNFKEFDSDNDGIVDNVYVFYAGYDEAAAGAPEEAVWAHEGTLKGMAGNVIDGVELNTYACSSVKRWLVSEPFVMNSGTCWVCRTFTIPMVS